MAGNETRFFQVGFESGYNQKIAFGKKLSRSIPQGENG